MDADVAHELFAALVAHDDSRVRAAFAQAAPRVAEVVRRSCARQAKLLARGGLEIEDVVQHVLATMLTRPPSNPSAHDAARVLVVWSRTVAMHYMIDMRRKAAREEPFESSAETQEDARIGTHVVAAGAPQERVYAAQQDWAKAVDCAEHELSQYQHLKPLFYAVAADPDLSARELARQIGLLAANERDELQVKRAEQYVWKLRERVQVRLAAYLARSEGEPTLPRAALRKSPPIRSKNTEQSKGPKSWS